MRGPDDIMRLRDSRRTWLPAIVCLLVSLGLVRPGPPVRRALAQNARPVVHVFLHLDAKSSVVEKTLQQHLSQLSVTVFGRLRDFEERLAAGAPDAVLSIGPVLRHHGEAVSLQGYRDGKSVEPYLLASINQPLEGSLAGKTIGVVELLGREGTQAYVSDLLKTTGLKIKRVAKVEDLLPLLEFSAADGVLLPGSMLGMLVERTRLTIKTRELPGALADLPAIAVLNPAAREIIFKSFQGLDAATKQLLGIDSWRVP